MNAAELAKFEARKTVLTTFLGKKTEALDRMSSVTAGTAARVPAEDSREQSELK